MQRLSPERLDVLGMRSPGKLQSCETSSPLAESHYVRMLECIIEN